MIKYNILINLYVVTMHVSNPPKTFTIEYYFPKHIKCNGFFSTLKHGLYKYN